MGVITVGELGERALQERLFSVLCLSRSARKFLDDDCAVFSGGNSKWAVTSDTATLGTHFQNFDPKKIGVKVVTSVLSDLYCEGAKPEFVLICLALPPSTPLEFVLSLYDAIGWELKRHGAIVVGGDTDNGEKLSLAVTAFGRVFTRKPVTRSGAKPGDLLVLTGPIGGAACAYRALKSGIPKSEIPSKILREQETPRTNVKLALEMAKAANAGIDVSDGLAFEAGTISRLSKVKVTLDYENLPVVDGVREFCIKHGLNEKTVILHCGEDYQSLFSIPAFKLRPEWNKLVVGKVEKGVGLFLVRNGREEALESVGWEHFKENTIA